MELPNFPVALEATHNKVWLSKSVKGEVFGLRGVSTGDIDILIVDEFYSPRDRYQQVLEVGNKVGKYDGATRIRLCLRVLPEQQTALLRPIEIAFTPDNAEHHCVVTVTDKFSNQAVLWTQAFARWSFQLQDPLKAGDILTWHWQRYYRFLPWCDVEDLARDFGGQALGLTLSEANRMASRHLYQRARDQGWRKLTLREQARWGLKGQWHRDEDCVAARTRQGLPSGVSEFTQTAASGIILERPPTKWDDYPEPD